MSLFEPKKRGGALFPAALCIWEIKIRNESVRNKDFDRWRHMSLLLEILFDILANGRTKETLFFLPFSVSPLHHRYIITAPVFLNTLC